MRFIFIVIFFISLNIIVFAQNTSTSSTRLEKIDTSNVVLEYQEEGIILGFDYPTVVITEVLYQMDAKKYFVFGFIDNNNYDTSGLFNDRVYGIKILKIKDEKCVRVTATSKNGVFAFSLGDGEKAVFIAALNVELYIKKPE